MMVKVERISEERNKTFSNESVFGAGIRLFLRLEGEALKNPRWYRVLKITEAVDDVGTDIKPKLPEKSTKGNGAEEDEKFTPISDNPPDLKMSAHKISHTYNLKQKLDDSLTFQIMVVGGQHKVTVPFDLKDIEMP